MRIYVIMFLGVILGTYVIVHKKAPANAVFRPPSRSAALEAARKDVDAATAATTELEIEAQKAYTRLAEKRKTLNTKDLAAVQRYNWEAEDYAKISARLAEQQKELARLKKVGDLVETEAVMAANKKPDKQVVMFSMSSCPACSEAKQFFSLRNVLFQERDVENSPEAAAEFRRLGGSGVPLIVINGERMSGFDPDWVDRQLKN